MHSVLLPLSSEDGEKKDHDKSRDEAPHDSSLEEKKALKKRVGQRKEPPEAFMASFLASLEIYQTKTLVSRGPSHSTRTLILEAKQSFYILSLFHIHVFDRTTWPETSTTCASWRCSSPSPSTLYSSFTK